MTRIGAIVCLVAIGTVYHRSLGLLRNLSMRDCDPMYWEKGTRLNLTRVEDVGDSVEARDEMVL